MLWFLFLSIVCFVHAVAVTDPCLEGNHKQLINLGTRNAHCLSENIPTSDRLCDNYLPTEWYITKDAVMLDQPPRTGSCGVDMPVWLIDPLPLVVDGISDRDVCVKVGSNNCHEVIKIQIKNCSSFYVYKLQQLPDNIGCPAAYCFVSAFPCIPTPQPTPSRLPNSSTTGMTIASSTTGITIASGPTTNANHVVSCKDNQVNSTLITCLTVSVCVIAAMTTMIAVLLWKMNKVARVGQEEVAEGPPMYDQLHFGKNGNKQKPK